jgi:hypothetical protein
MIKRDEYGIIVQHSKSDPNYGDGGDSAMRTGLMATCGSSQDRFNLQEFDPKMDGVFVRHPHQFPWNNPNNFTRDQLICYIAGCKSIGAIVITKPAFVNAIKRGFRAQNIERDAPGTKKRLPDGADLLSPSDMLFLAYCANSWLFFLLGIPAVLGFVWFIADLLVATRLAPMEEQNQIICKCLTYGTLMTRLYVWLHPNYKEALTSYWCGWRDQPEIRDVLVAKIESFRA